MKEDAVVNHTVLIVHYPDTCRVVPPHLPVDKGDTIRFRTVNTPATILIPNAGRFENGKSSQELAAGGEATFTVGEVGPGVYPYAAFCDETNDFAVGDSSPDLIVY